MQVGEVLRWSDRTFERFYIGFELNQVAGYEPRGETDIAQNFDQQPCGVATRSLLEGQGLLTPLDTGLEPDDVPDRVLKLLVQCDQEIHTTLR